MISSWVIMYKIRLYFVFHTLNAEINGLISI
jgi:hypothetical protein